MAFDIGIGGGKKARVEEPSRGQFPDNLNGAVQYSLAHSLYKVMERMGGAVGAFLAGLGVQFLERIEPSLVHYTAPLIDLILEMPELDSHLRTFFSQLRSPQFEGGAAILGGLATQAGGAVMGNALGPILAPLTYALNTAMRPAILGVTEIITAYRRGNLSAAAMQTELARHGFPDGSIQLLLKVTEMWAGATDVVTAYFRGELDQSAFESRMRKMGVPDSDVNILVANFRRYLDPATLLNALFRGERTAGELWKDLRGQGYATEDINTLITVAHPIPGPGDLVRMGVRDAFRPEIVQQWHYNEDFPPQLAEYMAKHGFDPQWAQYYWYAHWALPSTQQGYEMMHRDIISQEEMRTLLRVSDIPSFWREKLMEMSYKPYTRVDVRRMYGLGVLDESGVKRSYLDLGYSDEKAEAMTQFTILYEAPDEDDILAQYKNLTKGMVLQAFKKGMIDQQETVTRLMELGYQQWDVDFIIELAIWEEQIKDTPDFRSDYQKDIKSIVEKAYSQRIMSRSDALSMLRAIGCTDAEGDYLLETVDYYYGLTILNKRIGAIGETYIKRGINRGEAISQLGRVGITSDTQEQVLNDWAIDRNTRSRRLTESQYRKAMTEEVISAGEYQENMRGLGYTDYDIWILTALALGVEKAGTRPSSGPVV